jgi:hypothetical protein
METFVDGGNNNNSLNTTQTSTKTLMMTDDDRYNHCFKFGGILHNKVDRCKHANELKGPTPRPCEAIGPKGMCPFDRMEVTIDCRSDSKE